MLRWITILAMGYGAALGYLYVFQRSLLYFPNKASFTPASSGVPDMAEVELTTADGLTLVAWYKPSVSGRPTMVLFHGNAGHPAGGGTRARPYLDAGIGVLLVEYRGYCPNPGDPNEEGLYLDGQAALNFLVARKVPMSRIVLYGESLGTGVAVALASQRPAGEMVGAVVLEAPYANMVDAAAHHYP